MIRRAGENLAPAEVEEAIRAHPSVADVAVVGVTAAEFEEEVKAYVELHPDESVTAEDLREVATRQLSAFKVPRFWQFVPSLPRTVTGRVKRAELSSIEGELIDLAGRATKPESPSTSATPRSRTI